MLTALLSRGKIPKWRHFLNCHFLVTFGDARTCLLPFLFCFSNISHLTFEFVSGAYSFCIAAVSFWASRQQFPESFGMKEVNGPRKKTIAPYWWNQIQHIQTNYSIKYRHLVIAFNHFCIFCRRNCSDIKMFSFFLSSVLLFLTFQNFLTLWALWWSFVATSLFLFQLYGLC